MRLFGAPNPTPYVKDAFHTVVIQGEESAVNPDERGTKAAAWYRLELDGGEEAVLRLRLRADSEAAAPAFDAGFDRTFDERIREADRFHTAITPPAATTEERAVLRQARAGLLWSKQLYYYDIPDWLAGDPAQPPPPASRASGHRDRLFLERTFQKLLLNFTWWVNRKDPEGKHLFAGGFLGLDNIGVFDRSRPLPTGGRLEQADGTAWMAFYCATMLSIALELASEDAAYEDIATKFFEHFVAIVDAMNTLGGTGLWDEEDGFYYDQLAVDGMKTALRVRSMVGLVPLIACEIVETEMLQRLPDFSTRMEWFIRNRPDLVRHISMCEAAPDGSHRHRLLALPRRNRLERVLRYVLDENEFLSPYGIRSVSKAHQERPYVLQAGGQEYRVDYVPGESNTGLFGGNSNWRGPIWLPLNYLLIEALERYDHFYGDSLRVECPVGSGRMMSLAEVAGELQTRLARIFLPDAAGRRPCHGDDSRYATDPHWRDLVLFNEYFHGDSGRGVGASQQTGWTALVTRSIEDLAHARASQRSAPEPAAKPTPGASRGSRRRVARS